MPISKSTPPIEVAQAIGVLGERIRIARLRRRLSQSELAESCQIARRTVYSIEAGTPGIAIGHVYTVLWSLGLLSTTNSVADPQTDEHGKILDSARQAKRARRPGEKSEDNNF